MEKDDVLCFIVERGGASVPDVMHEFGATYPDARSVVDKIVKDGMAEFGGGLVFKPTPLGKDMAQECVKQREVRQIIEDMRRKVAAEKSAQENSAAPSDESPEHARVRAKWDGITRELYKPPQPEPVKPAVRNPYADDDDDDADERDDIVEEAKIDALLKQVTAESIAELEADAKAVADKTDNEQTEKPSGDDKFKLGEPRIVEEIDYTDDTLDDDDDEIDEEIRKKREEILERLRKLSEDDDDGDPDLDTDDDIDDLFDLLDDDDDDDD